MSLLDAPEYDPHRERRHRIRVASIVVLGLVIVGLAWKYHNWPEEHAVDKFFDALQQQDYEAAYGIWLHDPAWRQHPNKDKRYSYSDFYKDWGPGGEWGLVKSHEIWGSGTPRGGSSGVVVEVVVNSRAEHARLWVEKSDKSLGFSPD
jgi:hypothetical protein